MSDWCTLHAIIVNEDLIPDKEEITDEINSQCNHSRTKIYDNNLYILIMESDFDVLKNFAKKYADAFTTIGLAKGNNNGVGSHSNDVVTFYDVQNGKLNESKTCDCPSEYNGLQVVSTR